MKKFRFIFRYINKISPFRIWIELLLNIFKQFFNVYYGVYFLRTLLVGLEKNDFTQILNTLFFMLALNVLFWIFKKYYDNLYSFCFRVKLKQILFYDLSKTIKHISYEEFNKPSKLDECTRIVENTAENIEKFIKSLGNIAGYAFALLLIALYIIRIDYRSLLISVFPLLLSVIIELIFSKFNFTLTKAITRANREKNYVKRVFYLSEYSKELKITSIYKELIRKYEDGCYQKIKHIKKYGKHMALLKAMSLIFGDAFIIVVALVYTFLKYKKSNKLFLGDFIGLTQAITYFNWDISGIVDSFAELFQSLPFINDFYNLLSIKHSVNNKLKINTPLSIEFNDVSFSYASNQNVINNISIKIAPGQKIAIVGENGSGKTTFVKLLLGLLKPSEGEILLNGNSLDEIDKCDYYSQVGVLFQDFSIYPFSIKDNIALGTSISDTRIISEIKEIDFDFKYENINQNLTKEFDSSGLLLSGGQNQMLAFLRIAVKDCSLIILDEPTSALDAFAEEKVYKYITNKYADATIIFISHKLSSTSFVDNIYFFENGEITECGSHYDLLNKKGKYSELYLMQARRFNESMSK